MSKIFRTIFSRRKTSLTANLKKLLLCQKEGWSIIYVNEAAESSQILLRKDLLSLRFIHAACIIDSLRIKILDMKSLEHIPHARRILNDILIYV